MTRIVAAEVGRHVHRLIAELASGMVCDLDEAARRMLDAGPVEGAVRASVLMALTSAAVVYQARLMPTDAELIAVELVLTGCRADLVWRHCDDQVAIDELKWSAADGRATRQITALVESGSARWGADFAGVRRCPLQRADRTALFVGLGRPKTVSLPSWLEVR